MTTIALLIETGATPSSVSATLDLFRIAERLSGEPFPIHIFSAQGGAVSLAPGLALDSSPLPSQLDHYSAVIVPGFFAREVSDLTAQVETVWQPAIERLRALPSSTLVAASCYGTFVLAESGLLDNCAATTTWWLESAFAARYPKVRLNAAQALVDDNRVLTAGAMTAHTDLSLHLLRRLKGDALARGVGSIMLVDEAKSSQRPFMALQRSFGDPFIDAAIDWLAQRINTAVATSDMAEALHVSYRTLHRRFNAVTGMGPQAYLHALRVEQAKELLEQTRQSVDQIAAAVGYTDVSAFRRIFSRLTAVSPAEYRKRFRRSVTQ